MARYNALSTRTTRAKSVPMKTKEVVKQSKSPVKSSKKQSKKVIDKKTLPKISKKPAQKKVPKSSKKVKSPSGPKGYTPDQHKNFLSLKKTLQTYINQQLKDMLKKNLQSMSGNKDELIQKIADGLVLGSIPKCSSCFGGRPKFDYKAGTYHCSGYRDDEEFKNCHTTFQLNDIKRDPWQ